MKNKYIFLLLAIIGIHSLIITKLIYFPYPELFIYPYLTNHGLVPYGQIFDQHFPGLMFLPFNFDNLGMNDENTARYVSLILIISTHLLLFFINRSIFKNYKKVLLVNLLYLFWQPFLEGWVLWIDNFMPLFLLPAFYYAYKSVDSLKSYKCILLAGVFFSLAILFKQMALPVAGLVGLYVLFFYKNFKAFAYYLFGVLPIPLLMIIYIWNLGVIKDFWFWTVTFNLTTFAKYGHKLPTFSGLVRVLGIYSPAALSSVIKDKKLVVLLLIFIVGGLSGDLARFDFVHFQPSLPFVLILTVEVFSSLLNSKFKVILASGYIFMIVIWLSTFYRGHLGNNVLFFDATTKQIASKIEQNTKPYEHIYIFGPVPHLYQMSKTLPVGNIFVFQFPWFIMETQDKFLLALINEKPKLIVRDRSVVIEGNPITNFASKIDQYINDNYYVFDSIGTTEFMRPK